MNFVMLFVYIVLLILSLKLILDLYALDDESHIFKECDKKNKDDKDKATFILNRYFDDGMWPFAYLGSSILIALIFIIMPIKRDPRLITIAFLISFLSFYAIMSFIIHHYINPAKLYILNYMDKQ